MNKETELAVNIDSTELIIFSHKINLTKFKTPTIYGKTLTLKEEVSHLEAMFGISFELGSYSDV